MRIDHINSLVKVCVLAHFLHAVAAGTPDSVKPSAHEAL